MPRHDDLGSSPYRSPHAEEPREPWLERLGWGDEKRAEAAVASQGAIVAVHIAWGDHALSTTHLADDGDCDPWHDVGAGSGEGIHVAVRVRSGRAVFFFADDPASRVEGPSGELRLDALREEGIVTRVSADRYAIAMEPGVLYRTRRFGLTVTAEIVARPARLAPPKRMGKLAVYAALFLAAFAVGAAGNLLGQRPDDPVLEAHADRRDEETLARLLAEATPALTLQTILPRDPPRPRYAWRVIPYGAITPLCGDSIYPYRPHPGCLAPDRAEPWIDDGMTDFIGGDEESYGGPGPLPDARSSRRVSTHLIQSRGALSASSIERVMNRNRREIVRCAGRSSVERAIVYFVIGGDGSVLGSTATASDGVSNGSACLAAVVRRMTFARPADGGTVTVRYRVDNASRG